MKNDFSLTLPDTPPLRQPPLILKNSFLAEVKVDGWPMMILVLVLCTIFVHLAFMILGIGFGLFSSDPFRVVAQRLLDLQFQGISLAASALITLVTQAGRRGQLEFTEDEVVYTGGSSRRSKFLTRIHYGQLKYIGFKLDKTESAAMITIPAWHDPGYVAWSTIWTSLSVESIDAFRELCQQIGVRLMPWEELERLHLVGTLEKELKAIA